MATQLEPIKEVLGELFGLLEAQETNSAAILQFLKDAGLATDEKLAPYLERAGNASSVKWRAARIRMEFLLSPVQKQTAEPAAKVATEESKAAGEADRGAQTKDTTEIKDPNETKDVAAQAQALQGKAEAAGKTETEESASGKATSEKPTNEKATSQNSDAGSDAPKSDKPEAEKQAAPAHSSGAGQEDTKVKSTHP